MGHGLEDLNINLKVQVGFSCIEHQCTGSAKQIFKQCTSNTFTVGLSAVGFLTTNFECRRSLTWHLRLAVLVCCEGACGDCHHSFETLKRYDVICQSRTILLELITCHGKYHVCQR